MAPGASENALALADLGDVEWFDRSGEEDQLYAFKQSDGVYKRKKVTKEGIGSLKLEELSDVDISHDVPRRLKPPVWEIAVHLAVACDVYDGVFLCRSFSHEVSWVRS